MQTVFAPAWQIPHPRVRIGYQSVGNTSDRHLGQGYQGERVPLTIGFSFPHVETCSVGSRLCGRTNVQITHSHPRANVQPSSENPLLQRGLAAVRPQRILRTECNQCIPNRKALKITRVRDRLRLVRFPLTETAVCMSSDQSIRWDLAEQTVRIYFSIRTGQLL